MAATRSCSISRPHRIAEAIDRREPLALRDGLNAYRLVHRDADGLAGLAIDRYADIAVVHADSWDVVERWQPEMEDALEWTSSAYVKVHPPRSGGLSAAEQRRLAPGEPLWGNDVEELEVQENQVRYLIRPDAGLSVGLFLDMREVRGWLGGRVRQRSVLNLFAYTCSFGVVAALGGASRVVNVDVSKQYLEWGKINYSLNDVPTDDRDFIYGDAFDWLGRFARRGLFFDVVIVDPPSFSSTPFAVTRDFARLITAAARVVAPDGILVGATNHTGVSDHQVDAWLDSGLQAAERHGRLIRSWHEPLPDFPVATGLAPYLKVRALALD